jgi:hypothetical protein
LYFLKISIRRKIQTDYLLMNQCPQIRTRIGQYNIRTLYQIGRLTELNRVMGEFKLAVLGDGILREAGREEDQKIAGEVRLSKKRVEAGMN